MSTASTVDPKVMKMVENEIERGDPDASYLYERAQKINDSISELSLRQFHAKYPLQVKRRKARESKNGSGPGATVQTSPSATGATTQEEEETTTSRAMVRQVLLEAVSDLDGNEVGTVSEILNRVDHYVDRVIEAVH